MAMVFATNLNQQRILRYANDFTPSVDKALSFNLFRIDSKASEESFFSNSTAAPQRLA